MTDLSGLSVQAVGGFGVGDESKSDWSLTEGEELGGYRVMRPLGRGGMGEVYLVENVEMGKRYALKLLPKELAQDEQFRERFRREARVMADLDHPGVVRVNHMAEEGGRFFLVMDYVEGPEGAPRTLADELKERGKLPEDEVKRIALELSQALEHAHARGVVHRDIKPGNVLLDKDRRARLSDFGLARLVGDDFIKSLTQRSITLSMARTDGGAQLSQSESAIIGTYEYMSPEQKAARPADERSDVYSLGLIIYRMLTGNRAEGRFPLPSKVGSAPWWDEVIERCLAPEPGERYASVAEVGDGLSRAGRKGERVTEEEAPPQKTSRLAIASLVLGLVGLFLCLGPLGGIPGLILGIIALREINASRGALGGKGLATAGVVASAGATLMITFVLAGFLLVPLARAREQARRAQCMSNLKQIGFALHMYSQDNNKGFPNDGGGYSTAGAAGGDAADGMASLSLLYDKYCSDPELFACSTTRPTAQFSIPASDPMGSYGYDQRHTSTHPADVCIVADEPSAGPGGNSENHFGDGQNVLFIDGHVKWCISTRVGHLYGTRRDEIYKKNKYRDPRWDTWIVP